MAILRPAMLSRKSRLASASAGEHPAVAATLSALRAGVFGSLATIQAAGYVGVISLDIGIRNWAYASATNARLGWGVFDLTPGCKATCAKFDVHARENMEAIFKSIVADVLSGIEDVEFAAPPVMLIAVETQAGRAANNTKILATITGIVDGYNMAAMSIGHAVPRFVICTVPESFRSLLVAGGGQVPRLALAYDQYARAQSHYSKRKRISCDIAKILIEEFALADDRVFAKDDTNTRMFVSFFDAAFGGKKKRTAFDGPTQQKLTGKSFPKFAKHVTESPGRPLFCTQVPKSQDVSAASFNPANVTLLVRDFPGPPKACHKHDALDECEIVSVSPLGGIVGREFKPIKSKSFMSVDALLSSDRCRGEVKSMSDVWRVIRKQIKVDDVSDAIVQLFSVLMDVDDDAKRLAKEARANAPKRPKTPAAGFMPVFTTDESGATKLGFVHKSATVANHENDDEDDDEDDEYAEKDDSEGESEAELTEQTEGASALSDAEQEEEEEEEFDAHVYENEDDEMLCLGSEDSQE